MPLHPSIGRRIVSAYTLLAIIVSVLTPILPDTVGATPIIPGTTVCRLADTYTSGPATSVDTGSTTTYRLYGTGYINSNGATGSSLYTNNLIPTGQCRSPSQGIMSTNVTVHSTQSGAIGVYDIFASVDGGSTYNLLQASQTGTTSVMVNASGSTISDLRIRLFLHQLANGGNLNSPPTSLSTSNHTLGNPGITASSYDTPVITGIEMTPTTLASMATSTGQISLERSPAVGNLTISGSIDTVETRSLSGAKISIPNDFNVPTGALSGATWQITSSGGTVAYGYATGTVSFDPVNNMRIIGISLSSTGRTIPMMQDSSFSLTIPNIKNPSYPLQSWITNGSFSFIWSNSTYTTKQIQNLSTITDTTPLALLEATPFIDTSAAGTTNGSREIHLFFNKPVSLTGGTIIRINNTGSTNISDPNNLPFVNGSTNGSDVIVHTAVPLTASGVYSVSIDGILPATGVVPTSTIAGFYFMYQPSPTIRSVTPTNLVFGGYPEDVPISIDLGSDISRVGDPVTAHVDIDAVRGIKDIGPQTRSGSILSTTLHLDTGVQMGPKSLTVYFTTGSTTRVNVINIVNQNTTSNVATNTLQINSTTPSTGSGYVDLAFSAPIRLSGQDGIDENDDDASVYIDAPNFSSTGLTTTLMQSGAVMRINMSGIPQGSQYTLHLYNIVSASYGSGADTRILPMATDASNGNPIGFLWPIYWGSSANTVGASSTRITHTLPDNGTGLVPTNVGSVQVFFSRALSGATVTMDNIQLLKNNNPMSLSGMTLSGMTTAAGEYDLGLLLGQTLDYGTTYTLDLSNAIKDGSGYSIDGPNGYGNDQKISFTTVPAPAVNTGTGANAGAVSNLLVNASTPYNGATNVPRNSNIQISFNEPLDPNTTNLSQARVVQFANSKDLSGSVVTGFTTALDSTQKTLTLAFTGSRVLDASKSFQIQILGGMRSILGHTLAWSGSTTVSFLAGFSTNGNSDTSRAQVTWSNPWNNASNVPIDLAQYSVSFNTPLDANTINGSTVILSQGSTILNAKVAYDVGSQSIQIIPPWLLSTSTTYGITLIGGANGIKTIAGNTIDGDSHDGASNVRIAFTTSANTTVAPITLSEVDANPAKIQITFSRGVNAVGSSDPQYTSSILNPANYQTLRYATGITMAANLNINTVFGTGNVNATDVSLSGATITYDANAHQVTITGFSPSFTVSTGSNIQNLFGAILSSGITDLNGNTLGDTNNKVYVPIQSDNYFANMQGGATNTTNTGTTASGSFNQYDFTPVSVMPTTNIAGKTSGYTVALPINQSLGSGSTIQIQFPDGYDVTNVTKDPNSLRNANITGTGGFSFTVSTGSTTSVLLTLTNSFSGATTGNAIIGLDLAGIVNPSVPKQFGTDGYSASMATSTVGGTMILQRFRSLPIFIQPASTSSLAVTLVDQSGSAITTPSLTVSLMSPQIGTIEQTTDGSGTATFTSLPVGYYALSTQSIVLNAAHQPTTYRGYVSMPVSVSGAVVMTTPIVNTATDSSVRTLSINISGLPVDPNGVPVIVWASSSKGYFEKHISTTSGSIVDSMRLSADKYSVGVRPDFGSSAGVANFIPIAWISPAPVQINLNSNATYRQAVQSADKTLTVTVTDGTNTIPNASVWAYSPGSNIPGAYGRTDLTGVATLHLMKGSYTVGAMVDGTPPMPEKHITLNDNDTTISMNFRVNRPSLHLSGKIIQNNVGLQNSSVYAYQVTGSGAATGKSLHTLTDQNGGYSFFVDANTYWNIGADIPQLGHLDEVSVTIGTADVVQNLSADALTVYTISSTLSGVTVGQIANIWAENTDLTSAYRGNSTSMTASGDTTGTFSMRLKPGTYTLHVYTQDTGEVKVGTIVVSADANLGTISLGHKYNLTVHTIDSDSLNKTIDDFYIAYNDVNGGSRGMRHILADSGAVLSLSGGIYSVTVIIPGAAQITPQTVTLDQDRSLNITITQPPVPVSGIVFDQSGGVVQNAMVEFTSTSGLIQTSVKSGTDGSFSIPLQANTTYHAIAKSPWYMPMNITNVEVGTTPLTRIYPTMKNMSVSNSFYSLTGTVYLGTADSDHLASQNASVWAQAYNSDGSKNQRWTSTGTAVDGTYALQLEKGYLWKLSGRSDGYESIDATSYSSGTTTDQTTPLTLATMTGYTARPNVSQSVDTNVGGTLNDTTNNVKIIVSAGALDGSKGASTITTSQTTNVPDTANARPIGGMARSIQGSYDDGTAITDFNSNVDIELQYGSGELQTAFGSGSACTYALMNNLRLSYYDNESQSWQSLPTTISYTAVDGSTPTSIAYCTDIDHLTLHAQVNHLTLFTSFVSSIVSNASASSDTSVPSAPSSGGGGGGGGGYSSSSPVAVSVTSGVAATANSLAGYFSGIQQEVALKSGASINQVFSIDRNGRTIYLGDILQTAGANVSNIDKNLVGFAVGDTISTNENGSVAVALDGYTSIDLDPSTSVRISDAGDGFLSYDQVSGTAHYQFTHRDQGDGKTFQYTVHGKTSYATIRGTTLDISSDSTSDTYRLIEGKIDIMNSTLNKTVSLVTGDTYIAYADGQESLTGPSATSTSTVTTPDQTVQPADTTATSTDTAVIPNHKKNVQTQVDTVPTDNSTTPADTTATDTSAPAQLCGGYRDILASDEWCTYVTALATNGIINQASHYRPNDSITRAELLKIVMNASGVQTAYDPANTYSDIDPADWSAPYVSTAKKLGYISAANANFRPNDPITRAEAIKIIMNVKQVSVSYDPTNTYSDVNPTDWSAPYVSTAKANGFISSTNANFRPNDQISRGETSKIVYNIFLK